MGESKEDRLRRYHEGNEKAQGVMMRPEMAAWSEAVEKAIESEWVRAVAAGHQVTGIARGFIFRTGLDKVADSIPLPEDIRDGAFWMVIAMMIGAADADDDGGGPTRKPKVKRPTDGETVDGG